MKLLEQWHAWFATFTAHKLFWWSVICTFISYTYTVSSPLYPHMCCDFVLTAQTSAWYSSALPLSGLQISPAVLPAWSARLAGWSWRTSLPEGYRGNGGGRDGNEGEKEGKRGREESCSNRLPKVILTTFVDPLPIVVTPNQECECGFCA